MQTHLVTVAAVAILALVSGCVGEQQQTVASASTRCRDSRILLTCHAVDSTGDVAVDEEGASTTSSNKGKFASKSEMDRRELALLMRSRAPTPMPSPIPEPPRGPEPKNVHPPPPHH
jgi:hypothetical protein